MTEANSRLERLAAWYDQHYNRVPSRVREWAIRVIGGSLPPETLHYQSLKLEGENGRQVSESPDKAIWQELKEVLG